jgi:hypothetical protein
MELDTEQRRAAEKLAIKARLGRRCRNCETFVATDEPFDDEELLEWLEGRQDSDDDVGEFNDVDVAADAIREVVDEAPTECGCVPGA